LGEEKGNKCRKVEVKGKDKDKNKVEAEHKVKLKTTTLHRKENLWLSQP
jgi:hypothetical protein